MAATTTQIPMRATRSVCGDIPRGGSGRAMKHRLAQPAPHLIQAQVPAPPVDRPDPTRAHAPDPVLLPNVRPTSLELREAPVILAERSSLVHDPLPTSSPDGSFQLPGVRYTGLPRHPVNDVPRASRIASSFTRA